jgi:hypothetical protein
MCAAAAATPRGEVQTLEIQSIVDADEMNEFAAPMPEETPRRKKKHTKSSKVRKRGRPI